MSFVCEQTGKLISVLTWSKQTSLVAQASLIVEFYEFASEQTNYTMLCCRQLGTSFWIGGQAWSVRVDVQWSSHGRPLDRWTSLVSEGGCAMDVPLTSIGQVDKPGQ